MIETEVMGNALLNQEPLSSTSVAQPDTKHRKRKRRMLKDDDDDDDQVLSSSSSTSGDEKEVVEQKIMALQQIVPGGESVDNVDNLFETTAAYILDLQNQVKAMKLLANFFELLQKQKTKLGG